MSHTEHYSINLGERGRLVLPSKLRQRLNLQSGDRLIVTVDDEGGFRVVPARELARRLRGLYRDRVYQWRNLVDELIAERREEARREDEEARREAAE
jgi:AbrB family looped-hinge helix DNA binding protein